MNNMNSDYSDTTSNKTYEQKIEEGIGKFLKAIRWLVIPLLIIIFFNMFTFIVREDEVAVVRRLGAVTKIIVDRYIILNITITHWCKKIEWEWY